jgi:hypothetical protein
MMQLLNWELARVGVELLEMRISRERDFDLVVSCFLGSLIHSTRFKIDPGLRWKEDTSRHRDVDGRTIYIVHE